MKIDKNDFLIGMAMGLAVGAATCAVIMPKEKSCKCAVAKALKKASRAAENISDFFGG